MQVVASPFKVMKILSEYFGYTVPVCPIEGPIGDISMKYSRFSFIKVKSNQMLGKEEPAYLPFKIKTENVQSFCILDTF